MMYDYETNTNHITTSRHSTGKTLVLRIIIMLQVIIIIIILKIFTVSISEKHVYG